jgi:coproporphyrinogen III oxidase-like Fe-S oxidoreductase
MNYLILVKKISSKNNSAYWLGKKYIGIGPSHSYDGFRSWNIANNTLYIKALDADEYLKYYQRQIVLTNIS